MTAAQIKLIDQNTHLIQAVINHDYPVQKSNDTVKAIMAIAKELNDNKECSTCQHVIQDAFRLVWKEYKRLIKNQAEENG